MSNFRPCADGWDPVVASVADMEAVMHQAFAATVNSYHEEDQTIIRVERDLVRFVYINLRTSRQSGATTMIQCQFAHGERALQICSLQVSESLRRLGIDRELVAGVELLAKSLEIELVKVHPLSRSRQFWESVGYASETGSTLLEKRLLDLPDASNA